MRNSSCRMFSIFSFCWTFFTLYQIHCEVIQLNNGNLDSILSNHELVFVNFYADWCRFSQMLTPIFEEAERKVREEFPDPGKVALAKVDCDREGNIAASYQVSKYPTLKVFRHGALVKREYRGQRSADSIANFVRDQLANPISQADNLDDLDNLDWHKRHIIGYFDSDDSEEYKTFKRIASVLRNDCQFHSASGPMSEKERIAGNKIVYRPAVESYNEMIYSGSINDYQLLLKWISDKCIPLVREITFENAEELTEEGLPFMILFHNPEDIDTPERFKRQVALELLQERNTINFLTADGLKFTHPLHHLGKTANDLPVLAIDSFKHMYVWKQDPRTEIDSPGLLKIFIDDLKSGKLHREFHHGPDPTTAKVVVERDVGNEISEEAKTAEARDHIPKETDATTEEKIEEKPMITSPPESLFKKLAPSRTRYTILKDEL